MFRKKFCSVLFVVFTFISSTFSYGQFKEENSSPADHCEFYVDGFGIAETSYLWSQSKWIDSHVKINPKLVDRLIAVGFRAVFTEETNAENKVEVLKIAKLQLNAKNDYMVRFDLVESYWDYDSGKPRYNEKKLITFSYFIQLKKVEGGTEIFTIGRKDGSDGFQLSKVYDPFKKHSEFLGRGNMVYVDHFSDSPLFHQKKACEKEYR